MASQNDVAKMVVHFWEIENKQKVDAKRFIFQIKFGKNRMFSGRMIGSKKKYYLKEGEINSDGTISFFLEKGNEKLHFISEVKELGEEMKILQWSWYRGFAYDIGGALINFATKELCVV